MTPQQAEAGGSLVVPLSGGQRPGLTRETEMPTEQPQASRPFPPPWTQVPGTGRAGLKGKAGALRPCFQASPLPRIWHRAGSCWAAPRRITYSSNHHFPTACCVPGLEPEVKDTETGRAVPAWGLHSVCQNTAAKRRVLGVQKHRGSGLGKVGH